VSRGMCGVWRQTSFVSVAAVTLMLGLSGCSGDKPAATPGEAPTFTDAPALWNPCHGLDVDDVAAAFGTRFTVSQGTDTEPQCAFSPPREGAPAVEVNYQLFEGTLDDIVDQLPDAGEKSWNTSPTIARADEARILVSVDDDTLAVTGFVRTGRLVQLVNAVDPAPFQRTRLVRAVRSLLASLAAYATQKDAGAPAPGDESD